MRTKAAHLPVLMILVLVLGACVPVGQGTSGTTATTTQRPVGSSETTATGTQPPISTGGTGRPGAQGGAISGSTVTATPTGGAAEEPGPGGQLSSNGQQIYFTATSQRGTPISYTGGPGAQGGMMGGGMMGRLACVNCHGQDGHGGQVQMMMYSFTAPDIRYRTLSAPMTHEGGEIDPPYTDTTLKRAITQGLDSAGKPLDTIMPRWQMSDADLNDLIAFLKTLN